LIATLEAVAFNQEHPMQVEIWSDIACPWCYIGKRRFETALGQFEHADQVRVTWRSFELDPAAPAERKGERAAHLAEKYGTTKEQARQMEQQMTDVAATEGLDFRFDIARSGVTFDAHRVLHLASQYGLQDALKERFMRAYLTDGELMSDHETLAVLGAQVGISHDEIHQTLAGDGYSDAVREDERTAAQLGISAVPTFVIDRAMGASGAHPPDALLDLLKQGWAARTPVSMVSGGETCDVDGC
jgi:predicted DsbA family dithiol-disulfide isomerase